MYRRARCNFGHAARDKLCKLYVLYMFLTGVSRPTKLGAILAPAREFEVRSFNELKKRWDDDVSVRHYHVVIKDAGLVLGADTILVRMGATRSGAKTLAVEADRERLLTLLGVSYGHRLPPGAAKNI